MITPAPEARVRVHLLGRFDVVVDGVAVPAEAWRRRKARSLLKLLALSPRYSLHRDEIIDQLWPDLDPDAAGANLRQVVHLARRALAEVDAAGLIRLHDEQLSLGGPDGGSIWVDARAFEAAAAAARRSGDLADLLAAIDLYAGDLLPEDRYEDWAAAPREALLETFTGLLFSLAQLQVASGGGQAAVETLERLVALDPTHEDAHAALMRLHATAGRTGRALRQYARLRETLARELDVEPSQATRALHADIAAGRMAPPDAPVGEPAPADSLPVPLSRFIGREREVERVTSLLGEARLLTLAGAGGAGKSRLALEVARREAGRYREGVRLVELAALTDQSLVPHAVAAATGVRERPGQPLGETLADALAARELLLVLDNCEHVLDACAGLVEALLAASPGLRVLATSREALRVPGEVVHRVPPMTVPDGPPATAVRRLAGVEAVELFLDRVRWVRPGFALTPANAAAVARICQRLDGLPLALELAAARVSVLDPGQIADRLDDALGVLSSGSRTAPDRHKTLQATLDWSHDLLSPRERVLLRRLSVFAGGWTIEAAEEIGAGSDLAPGEVLPALANLVDKSLVQVENVPDAAEVRYRFLEPVRQDAAARLAASGEAAVVAGRHAAYFTALAEEAEPAFTGPDQSTWLARLDREHDNLRAALQWLLAREDRVGESRLLSVIWRYWYYRSHIVEGDRHLSDVVRRLDADIPASLRARIFQGVAVLAWNAGDPARSARMSRQALALYEEVGDRQGISAATQALGVVGELEGRYEEATRYYEAALQVREELGDVAGMAVTLQNLGNIAREQRKLDEAVELYERSLAAQRRIGNSRGIALALASLAVVALDRGDYAESADLSARSLELYRALGATSLSIVATNNLGLATMLQGDAARAVSIQADSLRLAVESGDWRGVAYGLEGIAAAVGLIDATSHRAEQAARLFGAADALRADLGVPLPPADHALYEPAIRAATAALGEPAFRDAWRSGQSLPLDDALAEALALDGALPCRAPARSSPLSPREREVAALIAAGHTNREIAERLGMAGRTVDTHVSNLLRKLGLASRAEVAAWFADEPS